jgi:uncharacterized protein (AIM24 family)
MKIVETKQNISNSYEGLSIEIEGELVPIATITMNASSRPIFFENHTLLWRDTQVTITAKVLSKGLGKRILAGLPVIITQAQGSGKIAFSREATGQFRLFELGDGEQLHVREHQFLFATDSIEYGYYRVKGITTLLFGGTGFFIDTFKGPGIVTVYGYGNILEKDLEAGEQIDVEPGAFLYKEESVKMELTQIQAKSGFFGGQSFFLNRFTGPGKLGIQSMTYFQHLAQTEQRGTGFSVG